MSPIKYLIKIVELLTGYGMVDFEQYLENDPDAVLSRISPKLCRPFGVSTSVIETRAKREGFWPPNN